MVTLRRKQPLRGDALRNLFEKLTDELPTIRQQSDFGRRRMKPTSTPRYGLYRRSDREFTIPDFRELI